MVSSRRTGTWETSLTGGWTTGLRFSVGAESEPLSSSASQREVLHSRRQGRTAAGLEALEVHVPGLEVPDFEVAALPHEHHGARDLREVAKLGRDEEAAGAVELHVLGETHEEALPDAELPVEARETHDARADGFPRGLGIEQEAAV